MIEKELCQAFCDQIRAHEVPAGFAVKTPYKKSDGDFLVIFLRSSVNDVDQYRIEDDGETFAYLEAIGVDFDNENRYNELVCLLKEHEVELDEQEMIFCTKFMPWDHVIKYAPHFTSFMLKVFELSVMAPRKIERTFKQDLIRLVEQQFPETKIDFETYVDERLKDYIVDILITDGEGRRLAIFAGSSELKALEAVLFWKVFREIRPRDTVPMIVLESSKPRAIKQRTLSRVMNSGLFLASMEGEEIAVSQKMADVLTYH